MKNRYSKSQVVFLKKIGNNIRLFRQKKGLSQESLASIANLDRTYIGSVERGERNSSVLNLLIIADSLEGSISVLLDVSDSNA